MNKYFHQQPTKYFPPCSLQSPTLDEFIVYKLAQALAAPAYTEKCIRVPSTGQAGIPAADRSRSRVSTAADLDRI